ncbi:hypothetical protein LWI28_025116 [Acer negundo]|uniref:MATH domain-containing protein n=1 Tax=Acer negundo TaxID=4023 RepID=A0AAD5IGC8_ACENE|nr:hypothetical protein LWI28_025116 [Acer negundo]
MNVSEGRKGKRKTSEVTDPAEVYQGDEPIVRGEVEIDHLEDPDGDLVTWEMCSGKRKVISHSFESAHGWETRYHAMNTISGIAKFIDLKTFSDPVNGYLLDDNCVFGVEVFVVKNTFKEGCLSMIHDPAKCDHTWKVTNFSTLVNDKYVSESFGCYRWYILLYPNGNSDGKGNSISLFLGLSLLSIAPGTKLLAKVIMRVKNQMNGKHIEYKDCNLYGPRDSSGLGRTRFISLAKLKDPEQGFLVDDTLIIEAEVTLLGMVLAKS